MVGRLHGNHGFDDAYDRGNYCLYRYFQLTLQEFAKMKGLQ
jgi:hypothetical protein